MPSLKHPNVVFAHLDPGFSSGRSGNVSAIARFSSASCGGNPDHANVTTPLHATKNCFGTSWQGEH